MATYSSSNSSAASPLWQQLQYPYNNNSNTLLNNTPYDNYLGNHINTNNVYSFAPSANQFLKCRPVSSKEEAMACQIDLDGSLWVFTDLGNNNIYTKKIGNDGTAIFHTYILTQQKANTSPDYITKEELNKAMQQIVATLSAKAPAEIVTTTANNSNTLLDFS